MIEVELLLAISSIANAILIMETVETLLKRWGVLPS